MDSNLELKMNLLKDFLDWYVQLVIIEHYREIQKIEALSNFEIRNKFREAIVNLALKKFAVTAQITEEIAKTVKYAKVYFVWAKSLIQMGQQDQAIQVCNKGLEYKPGSFCLNSLSSRLYLENQQIQQAIDRLKSIKEEDWNHRINFRLGEINVIVGSLYQQLGEHSLAIDQLTQAHEKAQKRKYFVSKIASHKKLGNYEAALDCCNIAISMKPQKFDMYLIKIDLLETLGKFEEKQKVEKELEQSDGLYSLEFFNKKRELEIEKSLAIKRQSQIKLKQKQQSQSQIVVQKQNQAIKQYHDAFFYVFTYFLLVQLGKSELEIQTELSKFILNDSKEDIKIDNFYDILLHTLKIMYSKLNGLSPKQIGEIFLEWFEIKIKVHINEQNLLQSLQVIVQQLTLTDQIQLQVQERVKENIFEKMNREQKNSQFCVLLANFASTQTEENQHKLFSTTPGILGLEHSLQLLGYMLCFPQLSKDSDGLVDLIFRLISQKDIQQFCNSQLKIKKTPEQEKVEGECLENLQKLSKLKKKNSEANEFLLSLVNK